MSLTFTNLNIEILKERSQKNVSELLSHISDELSEC